MKKIQLYISLIIVVMFNISAKTQTPGFLGKRFIGGYGFYFSPALINSSASGKTFLGDGGSAETGALVFNNQHELFIEYAVKKSFVVGFSGRFFKTAFDNSMTCNYSYTDSYGSIRGGSEKPFGFVHISGINYNLYGKLYSRKYTAPWGRYFMFGLSVRRSKAKYDPSEMYIKNNDYYGTDIFSNFGPTESKYTRMDVLLGFGRNRMIGNRVSVDYGFNINFYSVMASLILFEDGLGSSYYGNNQTNYISKAVYNRTRALNTFNAFIKIGYLLF